MSKQGAIAVALMASLIGQPAAAQGDGQLVLEPKSCQRSRMMNKLTATQPRPLRPGCD